MVNMALNHSEGTMIDWAIPQMPNSRVSSSVPLRESMDRQTSVLFAQDKSSTSHCLARLAPAYFS